MKKYARLVVGLLAAVMVLSAFTGCTKKENDTSTGGSQTEATAEKPKEVFVKIATGNTGGAYYPVGVAMGQLWSKQIPGMTSSAMSTGGTVDNVELLATGEAQTAIMLEDITKNAYFGTDAYEGKKVDNFKVVTNLWPNANHIVVANNIETVDDLVGKRIVVGAAKSGTEVNCHDILASFGIFFREEYGDKINCEPIYLNYSEAVDTLKNKQADAVYINSFPPGSAVTDLLSTGDFHVLSYTDEQLKVAVGDETKYFPYSIPAGTYPNQTEDIILTSTSNILVATTDLDEDTVYNMTKAMFENTETLAVAHNAANLIKLETATEGTTIPFHDGAIKYYKEMGVWTEK